MGRKRVKLSFIANESVRKATYKKRREGIMQKLYELTTLCGVEACVIVYKHDDPQPEVWPSSKDVQRVLTRLSQMPRVKMIDQERYLKEKITKAMELLRKKKEENRVKEMIVRMYQCLEEGNIPEDLGVDELKELEHLVDLKIKEIDVLIEEAKKAETTQSQATVLDDGTAKKGEEPGDGKHNGLEMILDAIKMEHSLMS